MACVQSKIHLGKSWREKNASKSTKRLQFTFCPLVDVSLALPLFLHLASAILRIASWTHRIFRTSLAFFYFIYFFFCFAKVALTLFLESTVITETPFRTSKERTHMRLLIGVHRKTTRFFDSVWVTKDTQPVKQNKTKATSHVIFQFATIPSVSHSSCLDLVQSCLIQTESRPDLHPELVCSCS